MVDMIPGARLQTFENSATMTNVEEVEAFNQALAEFVVELDARRQRAA